MDKSFRLVRGPFVVVARSTAIDGPRTGLRHVSLPRHQFYFYSPFFCFLLCLCPLAPSPRTMVWIILAPLASSPLGFGLFFTSFDPLLPTADASVSFPFVSWIPLFNPSLLHRDVLPFHWTRVGNPPRGFGHQLHRRNRSIGAPPTKSTHETVRVDARLRSIRARMEGEEARARKRG